MALRPRPADHQLPRRLSPARDQDRPHRHRPGAPPRQERGRGRCRRVQRPGRCSPSAARPTRPPRVERRVQAAATGTSQPPLRRRAGERRGGFGRAGRRAARHHRPQRRRQDHAVQHDHRLHPARQSAASCSAAGASTAWRRTASPISASRAPSRTSASSRTSACSTTSPPAPSAISASARCARLLPRRRAGRADQIAAAHAGRRSRRVGLADRADELAASLPYGRRKYLEIGRALATEPDLLILDEPAAGLNDTETASLGAFIRDLHGSGVTIMLVEHDMGLVMSTCQRVAVLAAGRKIADAAPHATWSATTAVQQALSREHPRNERARDRRAQRADRRADRAP